MITNFCNLLNNHNIFNMLWRDDLDKYWSDTIWQRTTQDRLTCIFVFDLFGTHHVHRITHESHIMTYFQCGPLMTCGGLEWEVESTTVTHSSADWWDILFPLA